MGKEQGREGEKREEGEGKKKGEREEKKGKRAGGDGIRGVRSETAK